MAIKAILRQRFGPIVLYTSRPQRVYVHMKEGRVIDIYSLQKPISVTLRAQSESLLTTLTAAAKT